MKSPCKLLATFFVICASAWGQAQPPSTYQAQIITFNGAPFGACDVYQVALNVSNGTFMWCNPSMHAWTNPFSGTPNFAQGLIAPTIGPSAAQQHTIPAVASDVFGLLAAVQTFSNKSFSTQIVSTVATGTAPLSIASTTQVTNLNAQLHGGLSAPASAIVGISDTQTLTNKTLTSPSTTGTDSGAETLTNKTVDISANTLKTATNTAGHVPRNNGTQYVDGQLGAADLSDGVTGTGAVVRGATPTIATPVINGASTGTGVQGTDSKLLTSGTVSGTGASLCTDANGGATTSGCTPGGVSEATFTVSNGQPIGTFVLNAQIGGTLFPSGHTLIRYTVWMTATVSGCTTSPVLAFRDVTGGSNLSTLTIANATTFTDSGALSVAMTAGHQFAFQITTAGSGCSGGSSGFNATVFYQ